MNNDDGGGARETSKLKFSLNSLIKKFPTIVVILYIVFEFILSLFAGTNSIVFKISLILGIIIFLWLLSPVICWCVNRICSSYDYKQDKNIEKVIEEQKTMRLEAVLKYTGNTNDSLPPEGEPPPVTEVETFENIESNNVVNINDLRKRRNMK
ncbi:MAG: hypothetical protein Q4D26_08415 [Clostridia bacterium]|nr:hypothetical protein [Clostridia bacterium]